MMTAEREIGNVDRNHEENHLMIISEAPLLKTVYCFFNSFTHEFLPFF
jgi:hypothetical protein